MIITYNPMDRAIESSKTAQISLKLSCNDSAKSENTIPSIHLWTTFAPGIM